MPVIRRRPKTTEIDRIIQLVGTGAGIVRTGFGIKQGIESQKLARERLDLYNQQFIKDTGKAKVLELTNIEFQDRQDRGVEALTRDPGELARQSQEMLDVL